MSRRIDILLLRLLQAIRFRWAEAMVRERLSLLMIRRGDVRGALRVRREGVERAVQRGGLELATAAGSYGMLLLVAGWIGEGIEYLRLAAWMTTGWPSGPLRDGVLYGLASGHALRGEQAEIVEAVAAQNRSGAIWKARLLAVRAAGQMAEGRKTEAVATYGAALEAAHLSTNRDLVIVVNNNLAGALIEAADYEQADARIAAAEALLSPANPIRASLLGTRTELALARGDLGAARKALDQSEALKTEAGVEGGVGWTLATRARLEAAAGNRPEAKRLLAAAAGMLEDSGALRAWRSAAVAIGEPDARAQLASPVPDPLLDRARALVRELPHLAGETHRLIALGIATGMAFALIWLAYRVHDRIPGGWTSLTVANLLLVVLLVAWTIFKRVPRR